MSKISNGTIIASGFSFAVIIFVIGVSLASLFGYWIPRWSKEDPVKTEAVVEPIVVPIPNNLETLDVGSIQLDEEACNTAKRLYKGFPDNLDERTSKYSKTFSCGARFIQVKYSTSIRDADGIEKFVKDYKSSLLKSSDIKSIADRGWIVSIHISYHQIFINDDSFSKD